jgi:hypothetical protein
MKKVDLKIGLRAKSNPYDVETSPAKRHPILLCFERVASAEPIFPQFCGRIQLLLFLTDSNKNWCKM